MAVKVKKNNNFDLYDKIQLLQNHEFYKKLYTPSYESKKRIKTDKKDKELKKQQNDVFFLFYFWCVSLPYFTFSFIIKLEITVSSSTKESLDKLEITISDNEIILNKTIDKENNDKKNIRIIDELGRIIISLEIRKQLNINGGDKFDFFVRDNYIIMKKSKTN